MRAAVVIALMAAAVRRIPCTEAEVSSAPRILLAPAAIPTVAFEVRGLSPVLLGRLRALRPDDEIWPRIFSLSVETRTPSPIPILGKYSIRGETVRFVPRFRLERRLKYVIAFNSDELRTTSAPSVILRQTFEIPADRGGPLAHVAGIYPSASELPENLLRMYLYFSAPMSQGDAYRYVTLLGENGKPVVQPFLELPQELWNSEGTRLTLLLEPGRVKQGLKPREEEGPILVAGRRYTLIVDSKWPDAQGRPLREGLRKTFHVVAADRTQPDPHRWEIRAPFAGSRDPVVVTFPKPLDYGMLHRVLGVASTREGAGGETQSILGDVRVSEQEKRWSFQPHEAWKTGHYQLMVSGALEDPAGNSIDRPFEVPDGQSQGRTERPRSLAIPFDVPPAAH